MALNIKNEEAHRLATEIAQITGKSLTDVVTESLREARGRLTIANRKERIMQIARETAPLLKDMPDHAELLYDPVTGLPR